MKRRICVAVFTVLAVSLPAQNVSDFEIQGNDDGTMTILNYKGMAKEIVIPEKIFNMPVTRLREGAFSEKGLTSVTIPGTVTFIGDGTFSGNLLTSVTIPETVEYIGNNAFSANRLTDVAIPAKVVTIGSGAFRGNRLTSVRIPDSVIYIGSYAFSNNALASVIIGNGALFIGDNAFYGDYYYYADHSYNENNQIATITLGKNVTYIGNNAFCEHRASSIIIPDSAVFIGGRAFEPNSGDSLTSITIGKYVMFGTYYEYGAFYRNGNFDEIYQNNDKRAGTYTYAKDGTWSYAR
ncbi:MAG: leucine-rich repeat domain-containing protein [Treponema sp.]|nr:leucine-rich repeat domain-containing protein [Treponema sp.]